MNKQRFETLAAAYGGAISRWPAAERSAARWFAFWHGRSGGKILQDARRLDQVLRQSASLPFGGELRERLKNSAHGLGRLSGQTLSWVATAIGTGLAAACAAGIGVGIVIAPLASSETVSSPTDPAEVAASILGNPPEFGDG